MRERGEGALETPLLVLRNERTQLLHAPLVVLEQARQGLVRGFTCLGVLLSQCEAQPPHAVQALPNAVPALLRLRNLRQRLRGWIGRGPCGSARGRAAGAGRAGVRTSPPLVQRLLREAGVDGTRAVAPKDAHQQLGLGQERGDKRLEGGWDAGWWWCVCV